MASHGSTNVNVPPRLSAATRMTWLFHGQSWLTQKPKQCKIKIITPYAQVGQNFHKPLPADCTRLPILPPRTAPETSIPTVAHRCHSRALPKTGTYVSSVQSVRVILSTNREMLNSTSRGPAVLNVAAHRLTSICFYEKATPLSLLGTPSRAKAPMFV